MSKSKILDKISGASFFLGFAASKMQYLPFMLIGPFINAASLSFYLIGYAFWFLASHFYPNHKQHDKEWYGFASFKEQHLYASILGILAAVTSIAAIAMPVLLLPAAWLFLTSNVLWTIGEYHKFKNPPKDPEYSESHQKAYLSYAVSMTTMGFIAALTTTLVFLLPAITIPALIASAVVSIGLGIMAFEYWLDCNYGEHAKQDPAQSSYDTMSDSLGSSLDLENSYTPAPEPYHGKNPLDSKAKPQIEIELTPLQTCFAVPTCNGPT